jgi:hypothetical protein
LDPKAGRIFDAVVGLLLAATCTLLFVLHLIARWSLDADTVVFLFLAGGVLAGIGFYFVYRLVPRRVQSSLFSSSGGVFPQPAVQDKTQFMAADHPKTDAVAVVPCPIAKPAELNRNSNRRETISQHKTREGPGAVGLVILLGLAIVLTARLQLGWGFLWLGIAGGGVVALVLGRWRASSTSSYAIPVAGGVVGAIVIFGLGFVMTRFHFLRDFLSLAVAGGIAVALFLRWAGRDRIQPAHLSN